MTTIRCVTNPGGEFLELDKGVHDGPIGVKVDSRDNHISNESSGQLGCAEFIDRVILLSLCLT